MNKKVTIVALIVFVLILDQVLKFWVKTNMSLSQNIPMLGLPWANLNFVENEGMAYGLSFGGKAGKVFLTVFRMVTVGFIIWYMAGLLKKKIPFGAILALALICAGAIGNIIDSVFYGICFSESTFTQVAQWMPVDGGYAPLLHGRVVDMFYFPLIDTSWPQWVPAVGGNRFIFFRPVFNVADSSISIGMILIILLYRQVFFKEQSQTKQVHSEATS